MKTRPKSSAPPLAPRVDSMSHGFLAAAVEHAADGIAITDVRGTIQYVNPSFTAMTGYTSEEAIGQNPRILKSGHQSAAFYRELWSTIRSGRVWRGELTNRRKDGSLYQEESRISPVQGADGGIVGFVAMKRDITERRRAEEAQAFLAAIVENSADSIIASTPDGVVLAFNRGAEAIFGYSPAEVIGRHMSIFVPPDRAAALEALAKKLRRGEKFSQYEGWCLHRNGHTFPVSVSGFPVTNAAGEVVAIANILRDITDRKKAESALRESEERFRSMADSSPFMMWVANPEGELDFINRAYRNFSGISCQEARAGKWRTLLHPDDAPGFLEAFDHAIRKRRSFSAEARVRRADGAWRLLGSRAEPWISPNGEYMGHIGLRADITERRNAELEREFQHSLIRAIHEGALDGILVVDSGARIVSLNHKFFEIWRLVPAETPQDKGAGDGHYELLRSAVLKRVKDPHAFAARLRELEADLKVIDHSEIELVDGRTLERYSTSLRNDQGRYLGRVAFLRDISDRKQAEQALRAREREARERLAEVDQIYKFAPVGLCLRDRQLRYVRINERMAAMHNMTVEQHLGRSDCQLVPEIADQVAETTRPVLERGEAVLDVEIIRPVPGDPVGRRYLASHFPFRSETGEVIGVISAVLEITARTKAEEAAQRVGKEFQSLFNCASDAILIIALENGRFLQANDAACRLTGYTSDELLGMDAAALDAHTDPAFVQERIADVIRHGETQFESRMRRRNAEPIDVEFGNRLFDFRSVPAVLATVRDIRERKQADQLLRESENRFRIMADSCPIGIWVAGAQSDSLSVNLAFRKFCGLASPEFDLAAWASLLREDDAPGFLEVFARAQREHSPFQFMYCTRRIDGEWRWVETNAVPRLSADGEFLGMIGTSKDITERVQATEAAKESEDRFRAMADGCPMPLWVANTDGEIEFVNQALAQFVGGEPERAMGRNWKLLIHPEDASAFLNETFLALREQRPFRLESRARRFDGEWRSLAVFVAPRFSPSGEFLGHVGLGADITERKHAEQALQDSEEKFRELTENIREVFWLRQPGKNEFSYISPAYEQIWGKTIASFYENPASHLEAIHPDDLEMSRRAFFRQDQGEAVEAEYRIRTPDGQEKWIRSRAFPVHDSAGKLVRIAGVAEDITEKKQYEDRLIRAQQEAEAASRRLSAQHALLESERTILRTFMDNVPDLMYVKDLQSRFVIANMEVARRMGAKNPEELIGKTDFDYFPPETARGFYEDEQRVIRSGEPLLNREDRIGDGTADGVTCLMTTKVPLFDHEGHVSGIAGIGRDITARKRSEDALRLSNRQLQDATERANQLALEAESANRAKSDFLANMSHEIRTPMNGVLGMLGLLLDSELEAEQRHFADVAHGSAQSLLEVINEILDFSRVEAGRLEIDKVDFNLHVLMGDLADAMSGRIDEKQVEFICAVAPNVCALLHGDPGRLRQVLMNLVGNAMKFTHRGEVAVRVEPLAETDAAVSLRFSVRDTGIGIPLEKQQKLFISFTQVDASTTRRYGGTGLGLAISRKLVELMGGQIGMESREGEGSEFWFTLPLGKQPACGRVDSPRTPVQGARILIVDDNATNREVMTAQMQSWGAIAVAVESGPAALSCMRRAVADGARFQVALLDMIMPGMDGAALGRAILADESLRSTPLVMMTSLGQRGDALRFREIGFAAYLVKPVRPSDMFDCLAAALTGERRSEKPALITRHTLAASRRSNARILLVEDNLTNQEVLSGMLRRMGWYADVRGNGKEALQALESQSWDLVLMDVQMPDLDGFEATRIIRDPSSRVLDHQIPIIATTAHAMAGDAEKCLAAGMNDYVSKPIDPGTLFKIVGKWLKRKSDSKVRRPALESAAKRKKLPKKPSTGAQIFNREAFLQRMMGDEEFAREVAADFVKDLPSMVSELREQVALGALESIGKCAHKIKGSAANVGGEALRDVALEMEQAGNAGNLAKVVRRLSDLEMQAARLREALQQSMG